MFGAQAAASEAVLSLRAFKLLCVCIVCVCGAGWFSTPSLDMHARRTSARLTTRLCFLACLFHTATTTTMQVTGQS